MPPYTNQQDIKQTLFEKIKKHRFLLIGVFMLLIMWMISWYSFLDIKIEISNGTRVEYEIKSEDTSIYGYTTSKSIKKFVKRGSYQVLLKTDNTSSYNLVSAPGFLQTANIKTSLSQESGRNFVGGSPSTCIYSAPSNNTLISWQCGGLMKSANIHLPPSGHSPSYSKTLLNVSERIVVQGVFGISNQTYVFVKHVADDYVTHGIYPVNTTAGLINPNELRQINELNQENEYRITPFKEGYLIYSLDGSEYWYFKNFDLPGEKINIEKTNLDNIDLYSVSTLNNSIVILNNKHYNPEQPNQRLLNHSTAAVSGKYSENKDENVSSSSNSSTYSEVVVVDSNNKQYHYKINYPANQARLCNNSYLCILSDDKTLRIYKINDSRLKEVAHIKEVKQILNNNKNINIVTSRGVLVFDVEKLSGHYVYTFTDNDYCGISRSYDNKLLVCISSNGKSSILLLDNNIPNDNIDSKIFALQQIPEIESISIYKNDILIVPKITNMIYDRSLSSYAYDPKEIQEKKTVIHNKISSIGLDTSKYIVRLTTD